MATATVEDRFIYQPNRTLGRSGYQPGATDRLHERANQLDALLCLITTSAEENDADGFLTLNSDIQRAVLHLAFSLATEINEIQEEMQTADLRERQRGRGQRSEAAA